MSQQEIYNFLKKNEGISYSARELADILNQGKSSINQNIKKLLYFSEIKWEISQAYKKRSTPVYYYERKTN